MSARGLRDRLKSFVPVWMSDRLTAYWGFRLLYTFAVFLDAWLEGALEAVRSWLPGYTTLTATAILDPSTSLPLLGRSRGIMRGEAETDATYAMRLQAWLDDWLNAGSAEIVVKSIQSYLGNTPMVRLITRSGVWTTIDSSGNLSTVTAAWDWDSLSNPERAEWWSDIWIVVYPTEWAETGGTLASLVGIWGVQGAAQVGTGHAVPRAAVDAIRAIVAQWKGAHTWVEAIIWSYTPTLFSPGGPGPDGWWGKWSKWDPALGGQVAARSSAARYWIPPSG